MEIVEAIQQLSDTSLSSVISADLLDQYDLGRALERVCESVSERELVIAESRFLNPRKRDRITLEKLRTDPRVTTEGRAVTRERVRQLEKACLSRLRRSAAGRTNAVVERSAALLRLNLGVAAPSEMLSEVLARIPAWVAIAGPKPSRTATQLLLWLAGPYLDQGGWLIWQSIASELEATSQTALFDAIETRGQPLLETELHGVLAELGIRPEYGDRWLNERLELRRFGDKYVRWDGNLADKAFRILELGGKPITITEISEMIPKKHSRVSLANRLATDTRFVRTDRDSWGLEAWGEDAYGGIAQAIRDSIDRSGGIAQLEDLVDELTGKFSVSASSVRSYASSHSFVRIGGGAIRTRTEKDEFEPPPPIQTVSGCFRLQQGWAIRVEVSRDTMRGSGLVIRKGLAGYLGLTPGSRLTLRDHGGLELPVQWTGPQATLGSQRDLAENLECRLGDYLFIEFVEPEKREFVTHRVRRTDGESMDIFSEVGTDSDTWSNDHIAAAGHALGFSPLQSNAVNVRAAFRARGELELAGLVEGTQPIQALLDQARERLRQELGGGSPIG